MFSRRILVLSLALAGFVVSAGSALAADRYASPAGSGTACTQEVPCSLSTAIGSAVAGDEVFALADQGDYRLGSGIRGTVPIHSVNGRARLIFSSGGLRLVAGSAEYLYVQSDSDDTAFALDAAAATATGIIARSGFTGHACYVKDATLVNTICWAGSTGDYGIELDGSSTLRNVTAVGGTVTAILALGRDRCGCVAVTDTFVNVIARASATGKDLIGESQDGVRLTIDITHSSYATTQTRGDASRVVIDGDATNQTAAPLFVDATAGNFHQLPGSPTIDAGVTDPANGAADVDGEPRTVGSSTDIGADEWIPPFPGVTLANQTARVKGRFAPIRIGCPAETMSRCEGSLVLTGRSAGKAFRAGRGDFRIDAGTTALIDVRISAKALKLLGTGKTLRTDAVVTAQDDLGTAATSSATIRLTRRP